MALTPAPINYSYDVNAGGRRVLMLKESNESVESAQIDVVLNWTQELSRLLPH